ncbi:unnamed protein product [Brassica napus]|uniref:(rape) hypothetical protein n=1 Tax=Brassica napus TaxID=3708 RepID=A0A816SDU1_BRANA|nr:unnamed protein product [Brassica napus]
MANYYEHYQIPYDFNQVNNNLCDHNYYDNNHHQQFGFNPTSYSSAYDPMSYNSAYYDNWNGSSEYERTSASVAYSIYTMSEPKHLFYDPNVYTTYESPPQFSIYRSVQGFNEPEFEEYDPTPYGGGYDIAATYGKPLPPSEKICYPPSTSAQGNPPSPPEVIAPVPLGVYDGGEKKVVKKRVTFSEPLEEARPLETTKEDDHQEEEEDGEEWDEDEDEDEEEEEEDDSSSYVTTKPESVDTGEVKAVYVHQEEEEKEDSSSYGTTTQPDAEDKGEVKAVYVPSGYGLEATDMCEVIFGGYFPCVLRNKRLQEDQNRAAEVSCWESTDSDPWKTTSDYLFGDSYPYGYENRLERSQFEISSYGYQRY